MRVLLLVALLAGLPGIILAGEFIRFEPPIFLLGPTISRSALGATYAYRGRGEWLDSELQITVVAPSGPGAPPLATAPPACVEMFLDELRTRAPELFVMPSAERLRVGVLDLPQVRWTRRANTGLTIGVTACGSYRHRLVAVNFATSTAHALTALPAMREQLRQLQLDF
ncbi:MAG: hypothetical protein EXR83_10970 [Gammaproteobacteria bacterium]|nr:hypothetical protein [Gammaproteobacteria bacterium]